MNTFLVGLIKAPFMALVIGMIAAIEGFGWQVRRNRWAQVTVRWSIRFSW